MAKAVPSGQTNQLDISGKYGTYLLEQNLLGVSDYLVGPAILGIMDPEVYKKLVVGGEAAVLRIRSDLSYSLQVLHIGRPKIDIEGGEIRDDSLLNNDGCNKDSWKRNLEDDAG
ncbi:hypothetical protein Tco_1213193 [Tanacetum coccineum]